MTAPTGYVTAYRTSLHRHLTLFLSGEKEVLKPHPLLTVSRRRSCSKSGRARKSNILRSHDGVAAPFGPRVEPRELTRWTPTRELTGPVSAARVSAGSEAGSGELFLFQKLSRPTCLCREKAQLAACVRACDNAAGMETVARRDAGISCGGAAHLRSDAVL